MIYKLLYCSQESFKYTNKYLQTLDDILKVSRENNSKNNITGVLIYSNGDLLQLLEGDEDKVTNLYSKIAVDSRHTNIKILMKGESEDRNFPDWFMGFKLLEDEVYSNYLKQNNILERMGLKDFIFNQNRPIDTIIDLISGKYDFSEPDLI